MKRLAYRLRRFGRDSSGAALVEFAILLPMMVLFFGAAIESGRIMWSYQAAVSGVRDASRYLARVVPASICTTGGSLTSYSPQLLQIVGQARTGGGVVAGGVTVNSVVPTLTCATSGSGTWNYRVSPAPIAAVTATVTITLPFARMIQFGGGGNLGTIVTTITDSNRIFGA